jgi:hypothetical protein
MNENTITVILLIMITILYLLPTVIAYGRDIPQRGAVTILNIVLGWTLVGWVLAFLWARLARTRPGDE